MAEDPLARFRKPRASRPVLEWFLALSVRIFFSLFPGLIAFIFLAVALKILDPLPPFPASTLVGFGTRNPWLVAIPLISVVVWLTTRGGLQRTPGPFWFHAIRWGIALTLQVLVACVVLKGIVLWGLDGRVSNNDQEFVNGYLTHLKHSSTFGRRECEEVCEPDPFDEEAEEDCEIVCTCVSYGPYWRGITSSGHSAAISDSDYRRIDPRFGQPVYAGSNGDGCRGLKGTIYERRFVGSYDERIPTTAQRSFDNALLLIEPDAPDLAAVEAFADILPMYPELTAGPFGTTELMRVIPAGLDLPPDWMRQLDQYLDTELIHLGRTHEVNILVVIAQTADRTFLNALRAHWRRGKRNDVTVVFGTTTFPNIDWVGVMDWTSDHRFTDALEEDLTGFTDLREVLAIGRRIVKRLSRPAEEDGYVLPSLDEYSDIPMITPIGSQVIFRYLMLHLLLALAITRVLPPPPTA